ncbi:MAG: hypothetical protein RMJ44_03750 [Cytophagales bacterium]|nr:hypothetical protein [Bernardetiaceae bacterium]MDW8210178.1 hypothetical protein [Cytophagales bacterium]
MVNQLCKLLTILSSTTMALWMVPTSLQAQRIDEGKFEIEKERVLKLSKAARNFDRMPRLEISTSAQAQQYRLPRFNFALPTLPINVQPLRQEAQKSEEQENAYRNLAKAGFGNYLSPYGEVFISSSEEVQWQYQLHGLHFSSLNGPVDGRNSGSSLTKLHGKLTRFTSSGKIYTAATYSRQGLRFYGYSPLISNFITLEDIKQNFALAEVKAGYQLIEPAVPLSYQMEGNCYFFSDRYQAREAAFQLSGNASKAIGAAGRFKTDISLDLLHRRDELGSQMRNLFMITPWYEQHREGIYFKVGARMAADGDSLTNQPKVRAYPLASAAIDLLKGQLRAFASLEGNTLRKTFRTMAEENPFLAPNVTLAHTNQLWELAAGVEGSFLKGLRWRLKSSYGIYGNLYFFANNTRDSSKFDILYDRNKVPLFQLQGEFAYAAGPLQLSSKVGFFGYHTKQLARPWHRPLLTAELKATYQLQETIRLSAILYHWAGIRAFSPRTGVQINLKPIWDLNLQFDYFINSRFSAFINVYNAFSQSYQRFLHYPVRGLLIVGGIGIAF